MNLLQVRRGQFVYYKNELHKVYSVRPLSRLPVLMYRIKDMEQVASRAENLTLHRPQHMDSFMLLGNRYTLEKDKPAVEDGYILITHPDPGHLDNYSLNEFEKVAELVDNKAYTTLLNTVKPKEFMVMSPGVHPDSRNIDYKDHSQVTDEQREEERMLEQKAAEEAAVKPSVGDIYINLDNGIKAMIVAVIDDEVILGHGERMKSADLVESDSWNLIYITNEEDF
ncbi:hypothetical protein [Sporosarcina ureilytica]|uniref:Uncharacterized protein n=1 Tax=Sporosarcina ureilytica TaxID=298596 RepID=A0A1D8JDQ2_9BACL|nr:hypothetical protein [Sporosarcina ureilytica]AOV06813.1 hypothetical protein BI350_03905 [Sporosarcina ureilytica]